MPGISFNWSCPTPATSSFASCSSSSNTCAKSSKYVHTFLPRSRTDVLCRGTCTNASDRPPVSFSIRSKTRWRWSNDSDRCVSCCRTARTSKRKRAKRGSTTTAVRRSSPTVSSRSTPVTRTSTICRTSRPGRRKSRIAKICGSTSKWRRRRRVRRTASSLARFEFDLRQFNGGWNLRTGSAWVATENCASNPPAATWLVDRPERRSVPDDQLAGDPSSDRGPAAALAHERTVSSRHRRLPRAVPAVLLAVRQDQIRHSAVVRHAEQVDLRAQRAGLSDRRERRSSAGQRSPAEVQRGRSSVSRQNSARCHVESRRFVSRLAIPKRRVPESSSRGTDEDGEQSETTAHLAQRLRTCDHRLPSRSLGWAGRRAGFWPEWAVSVEVRSVLFPLNGGTGATDLLRARSAIWHSVRQTAVQRHSSRALPPSRTIDRRVSEPKDHLRCHGYRRYRQATTNDDRTLLLLLFASRLEGTSIANESHEQLALLSALKLALPTVEIGGLNTHPISSASLTQWFQTLEDLSKQSLAKQLFELVGQKINAQLDTRCSRKRPSHPMREPTRRKSLSSSNTSSSQWRFTSRSPIHRSRPFSRSDWFHPLTTMSIDPEGGCRSQIDEQLTTLLQKPGKQPNSRIIQELSFRDVVTSERRILLSRHSSPSRSVRLELLLVEANVALNNYEWLSLIKYEVNFSARPEDRIHFVQFSNRILSNFEFLGRRHSSRALGHAPTSLQNDHRPSSSPRWWSERCFSWPKRSRPFASASLTSPRTTADRQWSKRSRRFAFSSRQRRLISERRALAVRNEPHQSVVSLGDGSRAHQQHAWRSDHLEELVCAQGNAAPQHRSAMPRENIRKRWAVECLSALAVAMRHIRVQLEEHRMLSENIPQALKRAKSQSDLSAAVQPPQVGEQHRFSNGERPLDCRSKHVLWNTRWWTKPRANGISSSALVRRFFAFHTRTGCSARSMIPTNRCHPRSK